MGNFQTGIKDEGVLQEINCKDCNRPFEAYTGKITIKGPTPDPIRCDECQAIWTISMHDNVKRSFENFKSINHMNDAIIEEAHINKTDTNIIPVSESQCEITLHYAKWCPHSKDMLPEWKIFEDYASKHFKDLKVTRICYEHDEKPNNPNVQGYPTIILTFMDNTFVVFDYIRRVEFFIKFVKENI